MFDRLVAEHAFDGSYESVKEAVRAWRQGQQEVFLPLSHPPGEAQVDFGFADMDLAGERTKVALFVMTLPYSDAVFVQAFPRECTEAFQEGHKRAFEFFGAAAARIKRPWSSSSVHTAELPALSDVSYLVRLLQDLLDDATLSPLRLRATMLSAIAALMLPKVIG